MTEEERLKLATEFADVWEECMEAREPGSDPLTGRTFYEYLISRSTTAKSMRGILEDWREWNKYYAQQEQAEQAGEVPEVPPGKSQWQLRNEALFARDMMKPN